jgi:hypothetical protein
VSYERDKREADQAAAEIEAERRGARPGAINHAATAAAAVFMEFGLGEHPASARLREHLERALRNAYTEGVVTVTMELFDVCDRMGVRRIPR